MSNDYSSIKVLGFDLDQTLYPRSKEIDGMIQGYIYEKIALHKKVTFEEAATLFRDLYQEGRGMSGRKTLETLGVPGAADIIQEALEKADIASVLVTDTRTINLLTRLKEKYPNLDLITGSGRSEIVKKFRALGIREDTFVNIISGEDASKSDGGAFNKWLALYPQFTPEQFLYIGDKSASDHLPAKNLSINSILVNLKEIDSELECPQYHSLFEIEEILL